MVGRGMVLCIGLQEVMKVSAASKLTPTPAARDGAGIRPVAVGHLDRCVIRCFGLGSVAAVGFATNGESKARFGIIRAILHSTAGCSAQTDPFVSPSLLKQNISLSAHAQTRLLSSAKSSSAGWIYSVIQMVFGLPLYSFSSALGMEWCAVGVHVTISWVHHYQHWTWRGFANHQRVYVRIWCRIVRSRARDGMAAYRLDLISQAMFGAGIYPVDTLTPNSE
jgi:hypothetical protein